MQPNKRGPEEHNKQDERHDQFLLLPSASHQILTGNSTRTVYTPGQLGCQPSTAHACGQNCSSQLMRGNYRVAPVEIRDGSTSRLVAQDCAQEATMHRQPAAGANLLEFIHEMTGPRHGSVTPIHTHEAVQTASVNGYDILRLAGFGVDPEARAFIPKAPMKSLRVHFANVNPDVLVRDLLKTSRPAGSLSGDSTLSFTSGTFPAREERAQGLSS